MIKRILYTFLSACLLATGFAGCDDDAMAPLPESVPLIKIGRASCRERV